ncbi:hypothetical protein LH935_14975 [Gordonia polyisoprenivorans]|uniref:hypothetical protein n=1 Tax=Gordonia polyisoprenivorans TaxID=84595 RepID=UPI0022345D4A|nr:hypothetical protein LH935_14975 [Gordonia polyisoprenivorans]
MSEMKPYRVPSTGMEYNEFARSLGPYGNGNPINTELHVRYGVRGGRYYDWTIEVVGREGDVDSFRETGERPERWVMESFSVEDGAVVRRMRTGPDPDDFEVDVVRKLYSGDGAMVDEGYDSFMKQLADQWQKRHEVRDPRTVATFGFAQHNRDAGFRDGEYAWVRNTIVCVDDDSADDVVVERLKRYFPDGGTVAVHMRSAGRMKFLKVGRGADAATDSFELDDKDDEDGSLKATGYASMGMMVDAIYRGDDWIDDAFLS